MRSRSDDHRYAPFKERQRDLDACRLGATAAQLDDVARDLVEIDALYANVGFLCGRHRHRRKFHDAFEDRCSAPDLSSDQPQLLVRFRIVLQPQLEDVQVVVDDAERVVRFVNDFAQTFFVAATDSRAAGAAAVRRPAAARRAIDRVRWHSRSSRALPRRDPRRSTGMRARRLAIHHR